LADPNVIAVPPIVSVSALAGLALNVAKPCCRGLGRQLGNLGRVGNALTLRVAMEGVNDNLQPQQFNNISGAGNAFWVNLFGR
jgi:hypothetical protein